jgi:hypothetical protein
VNFSDLKAEAGLGSWHFHCDNPTILGWTVVAIYGLAALSCAVTALLCRSAGAPGSKPGPSRHPGVWWALALALAFLGANKQLNFQTLLILVMRHVAVEGGWLDQRRSVQLVFSVAFGLCLGALLLWLAFRYREFFKMNPRAFWGLIILGVFVALRAATINHAGEFLKIDLEDKDWAWILEIAGSVLIGVAAMRQAGNKCPK